MLQDFQLPLTLSNRADAISFSWPEDMSFSFCALCLHSLKTFYFLPFFCYSQQSTTLDFILSFKSSALIASMSICCHQCLYNITHQVTSVFFPLMSLLFSYFCMYVIKGCLMLMTDLCDQSASQHQGTKQTRGRGFVSWSLAPWS